MAMIEARSEIPEKVAPVDTAVTAGDNRSEAVPSRRGRLGRRSRGSRRGGGGTSRDIYAQTPNSFFTPFMPRGRGR